MLKIKKFRVDSGSHSSLARHVAWNPLDAHLIRERSPLDKVRRTA
jgi:hypothetical protein